MKESKSNLHKLEQAINPFTLSSAPLKDKHPSIKLKEARPLQHLKDMPLGKFQEAAEKNLGNFSSLEILEALLWRSWALSKEQVQSIPPKEIQSIPPHNLHNMTPRTLKMMSPQQLAAFTVLQIKALRPIQIRVMTHEHFRVMSKDQVKALLPTQIEAMSGQQIMTLVATGKLPFMKDRQLVKLPKDVRQRIHDLKVLLFSKTKRKYQRQIA